MASRELVVLVHGLWMSSWSQWYLARQLRKAGYAVVCFKYPTVFGSLQNNSQKLLAELVKLTPQFEKIHITAHSLGGFVVLDALKKKPLPNIGRVILLASPINGSLVCQALERWPRPIRGLFGKSFAPLRDGISIPDGYDVVCVAGNGGFGIGHFIAPVSAPHDGAVSVEEVRPVDRYPLHIINVSHFSMLWSQKTVQAIAYYLRCNKFNLDSKPQVKL